MAVANSKAMLVCLVAILVGLATTDANNLPTLPVNATVTATVFCSPNGAPCRTCSTLPAGARAVLQLNGITISSTTTGPNGNLVLTAGNLNITVTVALRDLRVLIALPVRGCSALENATGSLQGRPILRRSRIVNGVRLLEFVVLVFIRVQVQVPPVALPPIAV